MSVSSASIKSVANALESNKPSAAKLKPGQEDNGFKSALELQFRDAAKSEVQLQKTALPATLEFSNHAVERMTQRGISFTPDQMTKIEEAARKASEKGSKEALIFSDDSALIVSLKNNKIVTVMDKASMKDNVFTNIDSTVIL